MQMSYEILRKLKKKSENSKLKLILSKITMHPYDKCQDSSWPILPLWKKQPNVRGLWHDFLVTSCPTAVANTRTLTSLMLSASTYRVVSTESSSTPEMWPSEADQEKLLQLLRRLRWRHFAVVLVQGRVSDHLPLLRAGLLVRGCNDGKRGTLLTYGEAFLVRASGVWQRVWSSPETPMSDVHLLWAAALGRWLREGRKPVRASWENWLCSGKTPWAAPSPCFCGKCAWNKCSWEGREQRGYFPPAECKGTRWVRLTGPGHASWAAAARASQRNGPSGKGEPYRRQ